MKRSMGWALALAGALAVGAVGTAPAQAASQGTITVSVVTPGGHPVPGLDVEASPQDPGSYSWGSGTTDATGTAVLTDLDLGTYDIDASGYIEGSYSYIDLHGTVDLSSATASLTLKLQGAAVTGTVTLAGKPVANAWVVLQPEGASTTADATTDAQGRYATYGLPAGTYTAVVYSNQQTAPTYLQTYAPGTVREPDATRLAVAAGTEHDGFDIALVPDAGITGTVVDKHGKPVAKADVSANNVDRAGWASATTDARGRYTMHGLTSGVVQVYVSKKHRYTTAKTRLTTGTVTRARSITLTRPKKAGTITGKVLNRSRKPKKHQATVVAVRVDSHGLQTIYYSARSIAKKGTYRITGVPAGRYKVAVEGANTYRTVTVKKKRTTKVRRLVRPRGATLRGVARSTKGKPVKGATVIVTDALGTSLQMTKTNRKGRFSVQGAVRGQYRVSVMQKGHLLPASTTVTVRKGHRATAKLRMKRGGSFAVTVRHHKKPVSGVQVSVSSTSSATYASALTKAKGRVTLFPVAKGSQTVVVSDPYVGGYVTRTVKKTKPRAKKVAVTLKKRA